MFFRCFFQFLGVRIGTGPGISVKAPNDEGVNTSADNRTVLTKRAFHACVPPGVKPRLSLMSEIMFSIQYCNCLVISFHFSTD